MSTVYVSWYEHECDWITKYCDEYHRIGASVPVEVLEPYIIKGKERADDLARRAWMRRESTRSCGAPVCLTMRREEVWGHE